MFSRRSIVPATLPQLHRTSMASESVLLILTYQRHPCSSPQVVDHNTKLFGGFPTSALQKEKLKSRFRCLSMGSQRSLLLARELSTRKRREVSNGSSSKWITFSLNFPKLMQYDTARQHWSLESFLNRNERSAVYHSRLDLLPHRLATCAQQWAFRKKSRRQKDFSQKLVCACLQCRRNGEEIAI